MSAVPLAEVKAHLQMDPNRTTNDFELQRFIDAAEAAISHRTGPLAPTETIERHDGGSRQIVLRQPRATALTALTYADGTQATLTDYDLDLGTGILYWSYGTTGYFYAGPREITVTYLAGFDPLPEDLRHAVKELTRHLWETQRGNNSARPGFQDEPPVAGAFSSWPLRVQELVAPYNVPLAA
ncbi:MAG: hypothetical protein ACXV5Q_00705 [Frankiaceae bacterium]